MGIYFGNLVVSSKQNFWEAESHQDTPEQDEDTGWDRKITSRDEKGPRYDKESFEVMSPNNYGYHQRNNQNNHKRCNNQRHSWI